MRRRRGIPTVKCTNCGTDYEETIDSFASVYIRTEFRDNEIIASNCPKCNNINERILSADNITELYRRVLYIEDILRRNKLL